MKFVESKYNSDSDKNTTTINLTIFIGNAKHQSSLESEIFFMMGTVLALLAYLGYFSVKKFRRVKKD